MEFECIVSGKNFRTACERAASVAPSKVTMPIVAHLLLDVTDKGLVVSGTDLDQAVSVRVDIQSGKGAITASAAKLAAISQKMQPGSDVVMKLDAPNFVLHISQGRVRYKLPVLPPEDFPKSLLRDIPFGKQWDVDSNALSGLLKFLAGTINTASKAYHLHGVHFDFSVTPAMAVATNGYTVGAQDLSALSPPEGSSNFTLPIQAFAAVHDLCAATSKVTMIMSPEVVTFIGAETRVRTKLIGSPFINWQRVRAGAGSGTGPRMSVKASELMSAADRISIVDPDAAEGTTKNVFGLPIYLEIAGEEMSLWARNTDGQVAEDFCPCESEIESTYKIGFALKFLAWATSGVPAGAVLEFDFSGAPNFVVITMRDAKDTSFRVINPRMA